MRKDNQWKIIYSSFIFSYHWVEYWVKAQSNIQKKGFEKL